MVIIGELTQERAKEALGGAKADIIYTDPPWGPRLLQYFRTLNGESTPTHWESFLKLFCEVVAESRAENGHVFVEMGLQWVDELAEAMAQVDIQENARWTCYYSNPKKPNALWYSGPGTTTDPSGLSGTKMTKTALQGVARPGALVFDPCCGKGMTAKCAIPLGMRFAGVELNPKRAEFTIKYLEKKA